MQNDIFYRLGRGIYKSRWIVCIAWLLLLLACIPFAPKVMEPFKAIGFNDPQSQSAKTNDVLNEKLGYSYNKFIILYHSDKLLATDPAFRDQIRESLAELKKFPIQHEIIYPDSHNKQISKNNHTAYATILLKGNQEMDAKTLQLFNSLVKTPTSLMMRVGGDPTFLEETKVQTQIDLYKSEYIATPVAIVTMLIVFGSVVAASLPIVLGGICAFLILIVLYGVGSTFTLSVFTLNIALLLGLCLSLDYTLLFISRYREELDLGQSVEEAIAITQATAGKAVFFSGLAVFISLSALLLFPINVLFSVGMGGLAAVLVSVLVALVLLPAILSILKNRINWLPVRLFKSRSTRNPFHHWLVTKVVKNPLIFFVLILSFLLLLGYPFLQAEFGISDFRILPKNMQSRQVFEIFKNEFGENKLSPILIVVKSPGSNILTAKNINHLYDLAEQIKQDPNVDSIGGIVTTSPQLTKAEYSLLYTHPEHLPPEVKKLLRITTKDNMTLMTVITKYPGNSLATKDFIKKLRKLTPAHHFTLEVTGSSVNTIDVLNSISSVFPRALFWIIGFTYLVLLILLRSLILPLKAILTTMLSLFTSYGILVLVIQQGYLHELLRFEPQHMLDISLLIIIFCALFGISMDYEVFLLSRIKEYYEETGDTRKSIISGIDRSYRIITSAAIIVVFICFSFMSADILIVKAFGLGIALAVFVDAFIIRTILVPATMTLLGKWNWYLPRWLDYLLPKIDFRG